MSHKNYKKEDRRTKYTKMVLKNSLLGLMQEKPVQKITVTELCRRADINRNTFYAHYTSPENLLAHIQNEFFERLIEPITNEMSNEKVVLKICQVIYDNQALSAIIFSDNGDHEFMERLISIGYAGFERDFEGITDEDQRQILQKYFTFIASGSVGVVQAWIRNDFREPPEAIAAFTAGLIDLVRQALIEGKQLDARSMVEGR